MDNILSQEEYESLIENIIIKGQSSLDVLHSESDPENRKRRIGRFCESIDLIWKSVIAAFFKGLVLKTEHSIKLRELDHEFYESFTPKKGVQQSEFVEILTTEKCFPDSCGLVTSDTFDFNTQKDHDEMIRIWIRDGSSFVEKLKSEMEPLQRFEKEELFKFCINDLWRSISLRFEVSGLTLNTGCSIALRNIEQSFYLNV